MRVRNTSDIRMSADLPRGSMIINADYAEVWLVLGCEGYILIDGEETFLCEHSSTLGPSAFVYSTDVVVNAKKNPWPRRKRT